ncbi:MAG: glycosyltransferase [Candidatus Peribacteraceae bacterium]|nr:glycosyltransferase [Candidatus Peribacteraceae bacterium]MDD5742220.1 glycosyltransferase [Candidatus Peribacteraceae bacterium]
MQIIYISQARFPTEKAHGHQIAQVCAAMVRLGHTVTLVAPDVRGTVVKDPRSYYGLNEPFSVVRLPAFDGLRTWWMPGFLAFFFTMRSYARSLRSFLSRQTADLLYTRSSVLLPTLLQTTVPVVLELHTLPRRSSAFVRNCGACRRVVCLTAPMRDELVTWGVDPSKVIVEGDGVNPRRFAQMPSSADARKEWQLPADRKIAVYVGSLVTRGTIEKGVRELLEAVALLKANNPVFCWIIGGPRDQVDRYKTVAHTLGLGGDDIRFEGPVPNARVVSILAAADVCVYPAPALQHLFFLRDTSPLKIFEYLAAGKPTVCADLPPLRGVIDPSLVHFCPPGNASALALTITQALEHPKRNEEQREALLAHTSWDARMERILRSSRPA